MSRHPPFSELEASRPPLDPKLGWTLTQAPQSNWTPGQGLNNVEFPGREKFKGEEVAYKVIDPDHVEDRSSIYKLMTGAISPRPVAFCSTLDSEGNANLAPFSYFNAVGSVPPMIMVSFTAGPKKAKDTCDNIKETKEFVVNIISEPFVEAANYTSIDAPPEISEWELSGLTPSPSEVVKPAGVKASAFRMECVLEHFYDMHDPENPARVTGTVVLGRVKRFHIREDIITENGSIDPAKLLQVSRLGGWTYQRVLSGFDIPRPTWAAEKERPEVKAILAAAGVAKAKS